MKSTIHDTSDSELVKQFQKQNLESMSKKILLSIVLIAMLLTACNRKKADDHGHDHTDGTHQHADGEQHANHENDSVTQEEFTVGKDSTVTKQIHDNQHESGEEHQH